MCSKKDEEKREIWRLMRKMWEMHCNNLNHNGKLSWVQFEGYCWPCLQILWLCRKQYWPAQTQVCPPSRPVNAPLLATNDMSFVHMSNEPSAAPPGRGDESHLALPVRVAKRTVRLSLESTRSPPSAGSFFVKFLTTKHPLSPFSLTLEDTYEDKN